MSSSGQRDHLVGCGGKRDEGRDPVRHHVVHVVDREDALIVHAVMALKR